MPLSFAKLADRAVIRLAGDEAIDFLGRLVTSEIPDMGAMTASALLTPQGKVQFAFLMGRTEDGVLLDCDAGVAADLTKRLMLYRLRAKIAIDRLDLDVGVLFGDDASQDSFPDCTVMKDERGTPQGIDLGWRVYLNAGAASPDVTPATEAQWHQLRRSAGVAEQGADYTVNEVFPTDINLDQIGGVSYSKGCFVGQEVVSRMHHRGTERRRTVKVTSASPLPASGADLSAGGRTIGHVMGSAEGQGLALVRIDRLAAALTGGDEITSAAGPVTLHWPHFVGAPESFLPKTSTPEAFTEEPQAQ